MRREIRNLNGRKFTTSEMRNAMGMYNHTYQRLVDLAEAKEIEMLEKVKTGGMSTREWKEIKINMALMDAEDVKPASKAKYVNPWESVYPEYFRDPMLPGTIRQFVAPL